MKRISKTILILAICAWTGNGTSLLNASNPKQFSRARVEIQQRRPFHERPLRRISIMNDRDFQYLYKTIKKKHFEKDQLEILSIGVQLFQLPTMCENHVTLLLRQRQAEGAGHHGKPHCRFRKCMPDSGFIQIRF